MEQPTIRNVDDLIQHLDVGHRTRFLFFWGHTQHHEQISKTCLSQWYPASFVYRGDYYRTVEHFMMVEKARLFGHSEMITRILAAETPEKAKALGRRVLNFDPEVWDSQKFEIVVRGNVEKFSQNLELKEFLLNTKRRVLAEASPVDKIWGIGLTADDPLAEYPRSWQGQNLLGFALMEVRARLMVNRRD